MALLADRCLKASAPQFVSMWNHSNGDIIIECERPPVRSVSYHFIVGGIPDHRIPPTQLAIIQSRVFFIHQRPLSRRPAMLGLMGFSGSLPLYVVHRCYIFVCWLANKDACLLIATQLNSTGRRVQLRRRSVHSDIDATQLNSTQLWTVMSISNYNSSLPTRFQYQPILSAVSQVILTGPLCKQNMKTRCAGKINK